MRNETRVLFKQYLDTLSQLNQVASVATQFSVEPSVQQRLEKHIQESVAFLGMINVVPVVAQSGETIGLDAVPHAGRTNTSAGKRRQPSDITSTHLDNSYFCQKTDYDTYLPYKKLDAWAHKPDFEIKIRDMIIKAQALARIMIGFNGVSIATDTDRVANPLLQDVNKGWMQKWRERAPQNVLSDINGTGKVQVGLSASMYKNLDALVKDAVDNLIDPLYRDDDRLRVIIGRDLVNTRNFPLINDNNVPTEVLAVNTLLGMDKIGGIKSIQVPYFPADGIMITPLENLSIYVQENGRRRHVKDEPDYDRITNYESSNDDYVVEYYEAGCVIENIELTD